MFVEVVLDDLVSLSSSSFFFFFLGTCAGMTGKGVVVRASSGVSVSIQPALTRKKGRIMRWESRVIILLF